MKNPPQDKKQNELKLKIEEIKKFYATNNIPAINNIQDDFWINGNLYLGSWFEPMGENNA